MAGHQLLRGAMQTKMSTRRLASGRKPLAATAKLASRVNTRVSTVQKPVARPAPVPVPAPEPAPVPEPKQAPPASKPQMQQPRARPNFILPSQVVAFILGGGQGADLYPLTQSRAEPAVPLFGSYRLIDIIVSNCLNSSVQKVYVLTQFNSRPLNRHLSQAYINVGTVGLGPEGGFVEPLNATLTARKDKNGDWFRGTADAVRQYLWMLEDPQTSEVEEVLVLCGDQIYQMDYSQIIAQHRQTDADVTLAVIPCAKQSASQYGVLELDDQMRVQGFYEKPEAAVLNRLRPTTSLASVSSLASVADLPAEDAYAANMGVYVFKRDVLERLLQQQFPDAVDFSRDVLAPAARSLDIRAFEFTGYWRDVGSLKSYYETSMSLIRDHSAGSALQLWDSVTPVYTAPRVLPPAKLKDAEIESSLVGQGCCIQGATIRHSILGDCTRVGPGSLIEDTITFGADWYEFPGEPVMDAAAEHPLGIGPGCTIRRAILDKNVRLGRNVQLVNRGGVREAAREAEGFVIRDGIICVLKNATLPDNFAV